MNSAHDLWIKQNGDNTLRLDYPITETSIVFDLGGYKGDWAQKIYDKYNCNVFVFEPVKSYYENIKQRFCNDNKIKIFPFGIGIENKKTFINIAKDSSSIINTNLIGEVEEIHIKSIFDFLYDEKINNVDLIKINIEGAEFELLEDVTKCKKATMFSNIQVQFHQFVLDSHERREKIRTELSKTHKLTYDFEFIWENWQKNV